MAFDLTLYLNEFTYFRRIDERMQQYAFKSFKARYYVFETTFTAFIILIYVYRSLKSLAHNVSHIIYVKILTLNFI